MRKIYSIREIGGGFAPGAISSNTLKGKKEQPNGLMAPDQAARKPPDTF